MGWRDFAVTRSCRPKWIFLVARNGRLFKVDPKKIEFWDNESRSGTESRCASEETLSLSFALSLSLSLAVGVSCGRPRRVLDEEETRRWSRGGTRLYSEHARVPVSIWALRWCGGLAKVISKKETSMYLQIYPLEGSERARHRERKRESGIENVHLGSLPAGLPVATSGMNRRSKIVGDSRASQLYPGDMCGAMKETRERSEEGAASTRNRKKERERELRVRIVGATRGREKGRIERPPWAKRKEYSKCTTWPNSLDTTEQNSRILKSVYERRL